VLTAVSSMVSPVETKKSWCGRGDLNPHAFRRHPLKMVCLPVPPLPHFKNCFILNYLHRHLQVVSTSTVCVFVCTFCIRTYADCAGFFFRLIRPNARLTDSARGCTYRIVVLMVSCPAMYCSVKASVYSPASVKNVWRRV
jgi:hypothetical protein